MRILIFLSFLFVSGNFLNAQGSNDPDAKVILDAVSAKFKTFSSLQASFTYKAEDATGKTLFTQKGILRMKGTKYRISAGSQEIFCNGTTVWNYEKSSKEVTISTLDASSGMITPQKLFTDFYNKDYLYMLNGEKREGNKIIQEIQLTPTDKSRSFHKVYLWIDKNTKTIQGARILEKDGRRHTYTVSSLKTNIPMTDDTFVFDKKKYPGVEEIDLR
ncbi:MAG: outer membrane lipoprotein carrier protein LolA [Chitinophagaceae bacterium]|nr:outer membrane lipoprotein carrier protein LolA [Chitinophagaceae bacterium]